MAGLESLVSSIYHEKQQPGSMLCAQHALNSLLQGPYFTAPDLSEIARGLDLLEERYDNDSERGTSTNMDDTGFFSVQVLEEALKVLGLNLVRWRSSAMVPYQDHPHTQLAFILNLEQHWFTLRRFGPASSNIDEDSGEGHWFNLNSFLPAPEWVGKLYLGMVLQQAETEGYSVFAVTQGEPSTELALPRTEADDIASTLPEPSSASHSSIYNATKRNPITAGPSRTSEKSEDSSHLVNDVEGIEDEDYELQAVLQASLASQEGYGARLFDPGPSEVPVAPPPLVNAASPYRFPGAASGSTSTSSSNSSQRLAIPGHADLDPVAASMERNRVLLQRMREQQEFAQRELWSGNSITPEEQAAQEARRAERRKQEVEEEEQLRRVIAESEAMAREHGQRQKGTPSFENPAVPIHKNLVAPDPIDGFSGDHHSYDDEDAELQAALKASLENIDSGSQHQDISSTMVPRYQPSNLAFSAPGSSSMSESSGSGAHTSAVDVDDDMESESVASDDLGVSKKADSPAPEGSNAPPSLDEIRRARLARFGS